MKFPGWLPVYGDQNYRGPCPLEAAEQATLINWLRRTYPDSVGRLVVHAANAGKRSHRQAAHAISQGLTRGAPDIIIPGKPTLLLEIKRQDHTQSRWQPGQLDYLQAAQRLGAYVCVALGHAAAIEATLEWLRRCQHEKKETTTTCQKNTQHGGHPADLFGTAAAVK